MKSLLLVLVFGGIAVIGVFALYETVWKKYEYFNFRNDLSQASAEVTKD